MPIFIVKAVQRSADGKKSAHVADKWPIEVEDLGAAKAFVEATPRIGWHDADTFEIVDAEGHTMACRPMAASDWIDEED